MLTRAEKVRRKVVDRDMWGETVAVVHVKWLRNSRFPDSRACRLKLMDLTSNFYGILVIATANSTPALTLSTNFTPGNFSANFLSSPAMPAHPSNTQSTPWSSHK